MQAKLVVPGNARAVRRQAAEGACKKYLQLMFVPNIFVQIFYQLLEISLNKANTVYKSYRLAIASSAVILATFAGCATEAPVVAAPAPAPVVQAPVAPVAKPAPAAPPKAVVLPAAKTVYFDFDSDTIKESSISTVRANADYLLETSDRMQLEGHADERGSRDYNMALGQKRAEAVKRALTALGVKADRIDTVSFGEDRPKSTGHDEAAWAENRRVDFVKK